MAGILKSIAQRLYLDEPARDLRSALQLARERLAWACKRRFGRYDRRLIQKYLQEHPVRCLHIGAGNHQLDHWLNADLFPLAPDSIHLDATAPFPLDSNSFDFISSNHMIEHVTYPQGVDMLKECLRILKPGGVLRISTPDFAFLLEVYNHPDKALVSRYIDWMLEWVNHENPDRAPIQTPMFVVDNFFRDWGHAFIYDKITMRHALISSGFEDVIECDLNNSVHDILQNISNEERAPEGFVRLETMTFEARKPAPRKLHTNGT